MGFNMPHIPKMQQPTAVAETLLTNHLSHYTLDEDTPNTRVDSGTAGVDLTENNTISRTTGILGFAPDFPFNTGRYLNGGDNHKFTGAFTFSVWLYVGWTGDNGKWAVTKWNGTNANKAYRMGIDSTRHMQMEISPDGTDVNAILLTDGSTQADFQWAHWAFCYTPSTSMRIYRNNVLRAELTSGVPSAINNHTVAFKVGSPAEFSTDLAWQGRIDHMDIYNRDQSTVTNAIAELYNSGTPRAYSNYGSITL